MTTPQFNQIIKQGSPDFQRLNAKRDDKRDAVVAIKSKYRSKAEAAFADILDNRVDNGEIDEWRYEPITVLLDAQGNNRKGCRYTPDFVTIADGRIHIYEVKGGYIRPDAMQKFRWARQRYPWFTWHMVQRAGKGGGFTDITP